MSRHSQTPRILALTALLTVGATLLLLVTGWRAEIAEVNSQANLIRLESFLFGKTPRAVLVGSSLTGRLLPSYFDQTAIAPVGNLGLDGSAPAFGLDLVLQRPPSVVCIEVNRLLQPAGDNEAVLEAALRSPRFRAAKYISVLRASSRPSSILYDWFKSRRTQTRDFVPRGTNGPSVAAYVPPDPEVIGAIQNKLRAQVHALQERGCRIAILRLPASHRFTATNDTGYAFGDDLAREFKLPVFDLDDECARRGHTVKYSDGMHLSPASAREAAKVLAELLEGVNPARPSASEQQ